MDYGSEQKVLNRRYKNGQGTLPKAIISLVSRLPHLGSRNAISNCQE